MTFSIFLLLLNWLAQEQMVPTIQFDVQPKSVQPGSTAELIWNVRNASDVFISDFGSVEPSGKRTLEKIQATTTFFMFAEGPGGTVNSETTVYVKGAMGEQEVKEDRVLSFSAYGDPLKTGRISTEKKFSKLMDHIKYVLDSMRYHGRWTIMNNGQWGFKTDLIKYEITNDDSRIRSRELSYLVTASEVKSDSGDYEYDVHAYIQIWPKLMSRPLKERKKSILKQAAEQLVVKIGDEF